MERRERHHRKKGAARPNKRDSGITLMRHVFSGVEPDIMKAALIRMRPTNLQKRPDRIVQVPKPTNLTDDAKADVFGKPNPKPDHFHYRLVPLLQTPEGARLLVQAFAGQSDKIRNMNRWLRKERQRTATRP